MVKIRNELLPLNVLAAAAVGVAVLSPLHVVQIVLGLPFVLFLPGYTLIAALFPKKGDLDAIARVALSFGLSIMVVPLIGLILNYTWAVRVEPVLYCVASFIFVTSIVAWLRRRPITKEERFVIEFRMRLPGWGSTKGTWGRILSVVLVLSILGAFGVLGYALTNPNVGERYTEFYILGLDGKAGDYPNELAVGDQGEVIVGVVNHEHEAATYEIEILIDGIENNSAGPLALEHDQRWEEAVRFAPETPGANQRIEFLLYKEGQEDAYRRLQLWVDVTD